MEVTAQADGALVLDSLMSAVVIEHAGLDRSEPGGVPTEVSAYIIVRNKWRLMEYPMDKANILIVEDEQATADLVKLILIRGGYNVTGIVASGKEAIDTAIKTRPDLILMDMELEGKIDGIMAFNEIRKVVDIPIIFLSVYTGRKTIDEAMKCNPSGYVVKPFKMERLLAAVKSALDWQKVNSQQEE